MSRRYLMAANWKMYKTLEETRAFFRAFLPNVKDIDWLDIVIAPPFTVLFEACAQLRAYPNIRIAAQNMYFEDEGAYTGEISPAMIKDLGVTHVILGHSERRHIFHEDDDLIGKKVEAALAKGLCPILCVGETLEQRQAHETNDVLARQLEGALGRVNESIAHHLVIAYEPVWAIGTGKTATPELAQEAHETIRKWMAEKFTSTIAENLRILYGGSVKPANVAGLMAQADIDGALVGGASLDALSFEKIVRFED